ncbi:MAG: hypothetical protein IJN11_04200 [Oscillospiraceae bacterium]|nr:hypothetical protein [Oscillospiraceae bacterium]MBQ7013102.1 hypothetical protein [Oscillospiraceae bacterium]
MKLLGTAAATLGAIGCILIVLEFVFKWGLVVDAVLVQAIIGSLIFLIGGIVLRIYAGLQGKSTKERE